VATNRDLSSPVPWRRSLRASRARRVALARRRRRIFRGRAGITLAIALSAIAAGGALAQDAATPVVSADGVYGPKTRAAVKRFQRSHGLAVDGVAGPQTLAALGVTSGDDATPSDQTASTSADQGTLDRIAQCESGGDPTAVSADGTYRGKYQFDRETWRQMGGSGDPADAPEAEQDRVAARLLAVRGTAPWPNCGVNVS
jgi:peptidoglycan hydrolase-like protein with peptidoglycan-binding domain